MRSLSQNQRELVLSRDQFTCKKCNYADKSGKELEIHHITLKVKSGNDDPENLVTLCTICHKFAPNEADQFKEYIDEKVTLESLNTFRKWAKNTSERTSFGMEHKTKEGGIVTKPPLGYVLVDKKLILDPSKKVEIKTLFEEYLNTSTSLNKLARKYNLTVNGLKKVLSNRTYLGEVKFAGVTRKGIHEPLINGDLFEQVQEKKAARHKQFTI